MQSPSQINGIATMGEWDKPSAAEHWQRIYRSRNAQQVSWYRPHLETSMRLLQQAGMGPMSNVIDVGGGASTLVDDLLAVGVGHITVLDLSAAALDVSRQRLGARAGTVQWIVGDVTAAQSTHGGFDFWHDRAVMHFLTEDHLIGAYAEAAGRAVRPGGIAVIGGFAPDGPQRCSGLDVARRSAEDIATLMRNSFELIANTAERHNTPGGAEQSFAYAVLRRR